MLQVFGTYIIVCMCINKYYDIDHNIFPLACYMSYIIFIKILTKYYTHKYYKPSNKNIITN